MRNIKTIIHEYCFNINEPSQAAEHKALCAKLRAAGLRCFETWGSNGSHYKPELNGLTLELETGHLFADQWNTAPLKKGESGLRVFDWAQDACVLISKNIKRGHWLEQFPAMKAARANRMACGYCGKQELKRNAGAFCDKCIGSEYLTEDCLHLLRMAPVTKEGSRAKLSSDEQALLLPIYKNAQIHGHTARDKARIAKAFADNEADYKKTLENAEIEYKGKLWLMTAGIRTDNFIYYSHTKRWSLGWRTAIDKAALETWNGLLAGFPYALDIKTS